MTKAKPNISESSTDTSTGQYIDPLFAIMIAAAVTDTVVEWTESQSWPSLLSATVVLLGYANLLLSWFGYHKSVHSKPIKGNLRFIITVVLLPLYLLTIIMYDKDPLYVVLVYTMIFFLWTVWEYFKKVEYNEPRQFWRMQLRSFNLIAYAALLLQLAVLYFPASWIPSFLADSAHHISLALVALAISWLRIVKSAGADGTPLANIAREIHILFFGTKNTD